MEFKYSISILFSNLGYTLKILVWILISLLLALALGAAIILPIWDVLASTCDLSVHVEAVKDGLVMVWDGSLSMRTALREIIVEFRQLFAETLANPGVATGLAFAVLFVYAFYCFVFGLSYYNISDIINKLMASNYRIGFASNLALNFRKACKYSAARLSMTLPIDAVFFVIMASILFGLFDYVGFFVIPILLVTGVVICTLRAVLFSGWLPRMLFHPEEKVYTSFTRSLTYVKSNIGGLFKSFVVTFSIVYLFATAFAIPTGGLISLILPSLYYFMLRAIELIGYYKTKGLSFYTDGTTVINTVEYGYRSEQQLQSAQEYDQESGNEF
ncbi:MAG: hypothetical protein ACI4MZ_05945 [Christensenellales bacterium]